MLRADRKRRRRLEVLHRRILPTQRVFPVAEYCGARAASLSFAGSRLILRYGLQSPPPALR